MNSRFYSKVIISVFLVLTCFVLPVYGTTEKRYFTTDTDMIGAIPYKLLKLAETGVAGTQSDSVVTVGARTEGIVGIRVWILHNDNSMDEVTAGTPVAQCTFTNAEGQTTHANTWVCPETAMIATDHVFVAVFWDRCTGGASWVQIGAASFMTEELGTTVLNGATWNIQYECSFTSVPYGYPPRKYLNEMTFYYDGAYDSYIDNFVYGVVEEKEWHNVAAWNFNLATMQWNNIVNWSFNLTAMAWQNIATWGNNLTTMAWNSITQWTTQIIGKTWNTIINWNFNLLSLGWHTITYWTLTLGPEGFSRILFFCIVGIIALAIAVTVLKRRD